MRIFFFHFHSIVKLHRSEGFIINTKCLFSGTFTHTDDSNLNGASLPRYILLLVTPPTHCDDTTHTHTHMYNPPTHYQVILQNTQRKGGGTVLEIEMLRAAHTYCFKATALLEYRNCQFPNIHSLTHKHARARKGTIWPFGQKQTKTKLEPSISSLKANTQLDVASKFKHPLNYMTAPIQASVTSAYWLTTSRTFSKTESAQWFVTTEEVL